MGMFVSIALRLHRASWQVFKAKLRVHPILLKRTGTCRSSECYHSPSWTADFEPFDPQSCICSSNIDGWISESKEGQGHNIETTN